MTRHYRAIETDPPTSGHKAHGPIRSPRPARSTRISTTRTGWAATIERVFRPKTFSRCITTGKPTAVGMALPTKT